MDMLYTDFDSFFSDYYDDAYRLAFLLCRRPKAATAIVFQALLAVAARTPADPEEDKKRFFNAVLDECEHYYVKKPHRTPKREHLQTLVPFPVSDALWLELRKPYAARAAFFLRDALYYTPQEIAQALRLREKAVEKLLREKAAGPHCAAAIVLDDNAAQSLLDSVYLRFRERNVPFELKLRRLKRVLDRAAIYLAAAVVLFCIAAIIYTANR